MFLEPEYRKFGETPQEPEESWPDFFQMLVLLIPGGLSVWMLGLGFLLEKLTTHSPYVAYGLAKLCFGIFVFFVLCVLAWRLFEKDTESITKQPGA